jgi:RecA/RadA recombinase
MKIGIMFGNPETTTGGNALKFYSSLREVLNYTIQSIQQVAIKKVLKFLLGEQRVLREVCSLKSIPFKFSKSVNDISGIALISLQIRNISYVLECA